MKQPLLTLLIAAVTLPDAATVFAQSYAGSGGQSASGVPGQFAPAGTGNPTASPSAGMMTRDGIPPLPQFRQQPPFTQSAPPTLPTNPGYAGQSATVPGTLPGVAPPAARSYEQLPPNYVTQEGVPPVGGLTRQAPWPQMSQPQTPLPGMPGSRAPDPQYSGLPPASYPLPQSGPPANIESPYGNSLPPTTPFPSGPTDLTQPIDRLTGLPLHMTSQWPRRDGALLPLPPPTVESPIPSPVPHARIRAEPGNYPVRPLDRVPPSDLLPTPDLPHLPAIPGPSYQGPIRFDGEIDGLIGDPITRDADALPINTPPNPEIDFPQSTLLDPSLFDAGNDDGQLDWIDLIEEYAGRMTRSDIPEHPDLTPKEERSWLRLEHWRADATWFPASGDDLGWFTAYGNLVIGLPKIHGLTVTPSYAYHMVEDPDSTDLPNTLHDLQAEVAWMRRFDARWRLRISGTVGFYSDHINLSDGLRLSGQSLVTYECNPDLQLVAGTAYLNLENRRMLPIGGLIWTINNRHRLDLIFPEWKFAFVMQEELLWTKWAYVSGGFWGRTWEIDRTGGARDDVTYSDWRVAVGFEKRAESDINSFLEVGIAFDRKLDYESTVGDYRPDPFGFVRGGFHF